MMDNEEISKKIDIFNKTVKKKIYRISALHHKGLIDIKKTLISHAN